MVRLLLRSTITLIASAFVGSVIIFVLLHMVGGDVALVILGPKATAESADALRETLGLNRPLVEQYFDWLRGIVTGDLGESYAARYDIADQISQRLEPTLLITFGSLIVSLPIALAIGMYSAMNHTKWRGAIVDALSQFGIALPQFFVALILVLVFAVYLGWLPAGGYVSIVQDPLGAIRSLVLPIATLALGVTATFSRFVRSSMIEQLDDDYIRTARAKGRTTRMAVLTHGLRNAAIPIVTVSALQIGTLIAGAIVVENVFVIPGIGRLLLTAVVGREVMVVQSLVFVILLVILVMNLIMDVLYGVLDPRIRGKKVTNA